MVFFMYILQLEPLFSSLSAVTRSVQAVQENDTIDEVGENTSADLCKNNRIKTRSNKESVNSVGREG